MGTEQFMMFGPPEKLGEKDPRRYSDDAPVPCERELLWPVPHVEMLGVDLMERLYGDLPRRTRLTIPELCRRMRRGHTHIYDLIESGSLDATDDRHAEATQNAYTVYRYSVVRFLFHREFVEGATRAGLPKADLEKCMRLAETLRREGRTARE